MKSNRLNIRSMALFYFCFFVFAYTIDSFQRVVLYSTRGPDQLWMIFVSGCIGATLGFIILTANFIGMKFFKPLKDLSHSLQETIGPLNKNEAILLALFSSISEEFMFRGILQAYLGLVPTAIFFGFLHSGPDKKYFVWTVFAIIAGLGFGFVYQLTGDITAPIAAHFIVNAVNLLSFKEQEVRNEFQKYPKSHSEHSAK